MKTATLEKALGYNFKQPALLERALTHRSWAHENLVGQSVEKVRRAENESFEFVGDSVLGLAVAEKLFEKNPDLAEGDLTLMKHRIVSTTTIAAVADGMDLGSYLRVGRGEEMTGGRKKQALLANTLEAVIAAVFIDGGYVAARSLIARIFADEFRNATPQDSVDYKSLLQETLQADKLSAPVYSVVKTEGPPHERMFHVEAEWDTGKAAGAGRSRKLAEMAAAGEALAMLRQQKPNSPKRKAR